VWHNSPGLIDSAKTDKSSYLRERGVPIPLNCLSCRLRRSKESVASGWAWHSKASVVSDLWLLDSQPNLQPCRGRPPSLDQLRYKQVAYLAGCCAPSETRHLLLISELLLLESQPNRLPCRGRPPLLDQLRYKQVAYLTGCSAPCNMTLVADF
jgi:hypothetical protein